MKDKILKFCKDHEEAIIVAASMLATTAVTSFVITYKTYNDARVIGLDKIDVSDGSPYILVYQKNGQTTRFDPPIPQ